MESKKRLALITTWFPPQKSVATNRMEAFASYLSENFEVEVFALNDRSYSTKWNAQVTVHYSPSTALFERLKSKQEDSKLKHKIRTLGHVILLKIVKNPLGKWKNLTLQKLIDRHKALPFDVIISSYAPIEPHLVAADFMATFPSVCWVADMRDEMSKNPGISAQIKERNRSVELLVNQKATVITSVSLPILNDFKLLCPTVKHFLEIRNGFNHSFELKDTEKNKVLRFGYFGSFYGTRKPDVFFEALIAVKKTHPDFDFDFEIYGAHNNFNIPDEFIERVRLFPHLGYNDAIRKMATMDCNVLIHPRSNQKGVFTGKLFDYISVHKSVLALVDKSDVAAELITDFSAGYVAECLDVTENIQAITAVYNDWKTNSLKTASRENSSTLHRSHQVKMLNNYLLKLV